MQLLLEAIFFALLYSMIMIRRHLMKKINILNQCKKWTLKMDNAKNGNRKQIRYKNLELSIISTVVDPI